MEQNKERKEKKRRGRRGYLADFHQTATGEYVYGGEIHRFDGPGSWKRAMAGLWGLVLVMLASAVAAGCVPAAGVDRTAYVTLPYALALVWAVSVTWLMARWTLGGPNLRDYIYQATVRQVKFRGVATAACTAATLIGECVFLLRNGWCGRMGGTVALLLLLAAELVTVTVWTMLAGRLRWSK